MQPERRQQYKDLFARTGATQLYEIQNIPIPGGNRIFAKEEYRNPSESHYDRAYLKLLYESEIRGEISPETTHIVENSSGNAGASVAWACRELGYDCLVILPAGLPSGRIEFVQQYGCDLRLTEASKYVAGTREELERICRHEKYAASGKRYWTLNHSRRDTTTAAFSEIATEALDQLGEPGGFDYFIAAIGNGSTVLGPGRALKRRCPGIKIICWEPFSSPYAFRQRYPGRYEEEFGIAPGSLGLHTLYGTGVFDVRFPFIDGAVREEVGGVPLVDEVLLVGDGSVQEGYIRALNGVDATQLERWQRSFDQLVRWDRWKEPLYEVEGVEVGHSSIASLGVAQQIAEREEGKKILVIFYDTAKKYHGKAYGVGS